jgi:putative addiction module component (TIGR02574 family)
MRSVVASRRIAAAWCTATPLLGDPGAANATHGLETPDFSHLTPDERIELAARLWDSLPIEAIQPVDLQVAELRRRRAQLAADGDPGLPWKQTLDEIDRGK